MKEKDKNEYEDIIGIPHHVSTTHPHMSIYDRAAQFSPFAALTGHDAAIKETARLTDEQMELDENARELLDEKLRTLMERLADRPVVQITYFQPDERKAGGAYLTAEGVIKKIDQFEQTIVMQDGTRILIKQIVELMVDE